MLLMKGSESRLKTLYFIIVSELLYYKKTRKDIEIILFEIKLYDICMANQNDNGK